MKNIILLVLMLVLITGISNAQLSPQISSINGVVYGATEKGKEPLEGAIVLLQMELDKLNH